MPPNEECPGCGRKVPDWHREWHIPADQVKIFQGLAGMECPFCGALVMHAQWQTPLSLPLPGRPIERVRRDVTQAAYWASGNLKSLAGYLKTLEGQPFDGYWTAAEVQQADQFVAQNP